MPVHKIIGDHHRLGPHQLPGERGDQGGEKNDNPQASATRGLCE